MNCCFATNINNLLSHPSWRFILISFHFSYRIGESGDWDTLPQIHTNFSSTSYQMTGLLPFTIYSFRVLAVNSLGISLPSKESYYIVTLREGLYSSWNPTSALSRWKFRMIYAYDSLSQNYTINPYFQKQIFESKFYCYNFMLLRFPHRTSTFFTLVVHIKRRNEFFSSHHSKENRYHKKFWYFVSPTTLHKATRICSEI